MIQKVYEDEQLGKIIIRKNKRSKSIRIKVDGCGNVTITIPSWMPYKGAMLYLSSKRKQVKEAVVRARKRLSSVTEESGSHSIEQQIELWRKEAKEKIIPRCQLLAKKYDLSPNSIRIKHNTSNWGSCSHKGNINLNLHLVRLPEDLRDYVILHELCHLKYMNHGVEFYRLLESLYGKEYGEEEKGRELVKEKKKGLKSYILF